MSRIRTLRLWLKWARLNVPNPVPIMGSVGRRTKRAGVGVEVVSIRMKALIPVWLDRLMLNGCIRLGKWV